MIKNPNQKKPTDQPSGVIGKALEPLRVGIVCSELNREDILYYRQELALITHQMKGKITLILFGFDGTIQGKNYLDNVDFEFVKPTSIINYMKQLKALNLDLMFVPLINNTYNATSENYNKYLEAGLIGVPLLVANIAPYNTRIVDKSNGFLYKERHELFPIFEHLYIQRELVSAVGRAAEKDVLNGFNYNHSNVRRVSNLFGIERDQ